MKLFTMILVVLFGVNAFAQTLTRSSQERLDLILKFFSGEEYDPNAWAYFETTDGTIVFIDGKGNYKLKNLPYDETNGFTQDGLAMVFKNNKSGFINRKGELVIPLMYDGLFNYQNGLAVAIIDGKYGYIDTKGKTVIPFIYERADSFDETLAAVKKIGKYGFINRKGTLVIPYKYSNATSFTNDRGAVAMKVIEIVEKWGFIDPSGKLIIDYKYYYVQSFDSDGKAEVTSYNGNSRDRHVIDKYGNRL
jgi:hypothetical protein